jgi:hypothetical protein
MSVVDHCGYIEPESLTDQKECRGRLSGPQGLDSKPLISEYRINLRSQKKIDSA